MPPQIMWSEFNANQTPGLPYHHPRCVIAHWKKPAVGLSTRFIDVLFQTVSNLLGNERHLGLPSALWRCQDDLSALDVQWAHFQDLSDSHPTSGHQFQHDPAPRFGGPKDDFIDQVLLDDCPRLRWALLEQFAKHRSVTGI